MKSPHADQYFEYVFENTRWLFHIPRAWSMIELTKKKFGLEPRLCTAIDMEAIHGVNTFIDPSKLREADPSISGISVLLDHPDAPMNPFAVLIDGSHRAHVAHHMGLEFSSYMLPKEIWAFCALTNLETAIWEAEVPMEDRVQVGPMNSITREDVLKEIERAA
jgi:hypothetical protein